MGRYWKETEDGKIFKPFFDKELITEEIKREDGYSLGGYIQSRSTDKKYRWGSDWSATFTLAATNMAKHLAKQGMLPDIGGSERSTYILAKLYLRDWLGDEHDTV